MAILRIVVNDNRIGYGDIRTEREARRMTTDWTDLTKGILKAEIARRHLTYKDVAAALAMHGISETEANLRNKISRGGFSAVFFVQCLVAIGAHTVRLHEAD